MSTWHRRDFIKGMASAAALAGLPGMARAQTPRVQTVAGIGEPGFEENAPGGLPATATPIDNPYGVIFGPDGALYFCEVDSGRIRRVNLPDNSLRTIAGNGEKGFDPESRRPLETPFSAPHEIRWDMENSLYVVERDSHTVRRIAGQTGLVTTLAGNGQPGFEGDGRPAVLSQLRQPHSIAFDSRNNLLICDLGNGRLREVSRETGVISTIAGTGEAEATPDSGPMAGTPLRGPRSIDADANGNAYLVLREGNAVYQLNLRDNRLQRVAGTGERGYSGDGGPAIEATFNGPKGIAFSPADNSLYVVDTENHVVRRVSLSTGLIHTVLGTGERGAGDDGEPLACMLNRPHGACVQGGVLFVSDSENHRIRAVTGLVNSPPPQA